MMQSNVAGMLCSCSKQSNTLQLAFLIALSNFNLILLSDSFGCFDLYKDFMSIREMRGGLISFSTVQLPYFGGDKIEYKRRILYICRNVGVAG